MEEITTANKLKSMAQASSLLPASDSFFSSSFAVILANCVQGKSIFPNLSKLLKSIQFNHSDYQSLAADW